MLAISPFCAALGVALGTRFKILVLGPAFVIALVTTISFGIAVGWGFREMAATLMISLVALQVGYLAGSLVSHFVSTVRFKRAIVRMSLSPLAYQRAGDGLRIRPPDVVAPFSAPRLLDAWGIINLTNIWASVLRFRAWLPPSVNGFNSA